MGWSRLLRRCLEKDRKRRLDSAADARLEIEDALTAPAGDLAPAGIAAPGRSSRLAWGTAAALAVGFVVALVHATLSLRRPDPPPVVVTRLDIITPSAADLLAFALLDRALREGSE